MKKTGLSGRFKGGWGLGIIGLAPLTIASAALAAHPVADQTSPEGYLSAEVIDQLVLAIPAAPMAGSDQDLTDKALSAQYRQLEDSDRWLLATGHSELRPPLALQHFDCTLGFRLSTAETPQLTQVFMRLMHDADGVAERVKARAARPRPVGDDPQRRSCQRVSEAGRQSSSYPSGSATVAAAYGEALADLVPEQAAALRATAHQISLSRIVCGMHYPSDVAEGEKAGRAVFTAIAQQPAYQHDRQAALAEIAAARALGQTSPSCAAEAVALKTPLP